MENTKLTFEEIKAHRNLTNRLADLADALTRLRFDLLPEKVDQFDQLSDPNLIRKLINKAFMGLGTIGSACQAEYLAVAKTPELGAKQMVELTAAYTRLVQAGITPDLSTRD